MSDLTAVLLAAASADKNAEQQLKDAEASNPGEFAKALATELASDGKNEMARQLAGIYLKNMLSAKEMQLQIQKHEAWMNLPDDAVRKPTKAALLKALESSSRSIHSTAAQTIAEIGAIEIPYGQWPEFMKQVLANVTGETPDHTKVSSLMAVGYTCERLAEMDHIPAVQKEMTDSMLTTIVNGMQENRPDQVRLAAAEAMKNSLYFTEGNMEMTAERDAIMNNIKQATQSGTSALRAMAWQCIHQITVLYYEKLQPYMDSLFQLSTAAISQDDQEVGKQAIEFWSQLCEVEIDLQDEELDAQARGLPYEQKCVKYAASAVPHLVPLLLQAMTKQDEDANSDGDQFTFSIAASTSLTLMASAVGDLVVPHVLPFVQQYIRDENWHFREAATMAFACVLEGASEESIGIPVSQSIPGLLGALDDPHALVRDTSAFAISKICEVHVRAIPSDTLPALINGLLNKLATEPPPVARQVCDALARLGAAFDNDDGAATRGTNALSPFMQRLLQIMLQTADRPDATEHSLIGTVLVTMTFFVSNAAPDVKHLLIQLLPEAIRRLEATFAVQPLNNEEQMQKEALQGLLCSLIQVLVQKLEKEEMSQFADSIMSNQLRVLQTKSGESHAEAFSSISVVADKMGEDFLKYMQALQPFLLGGLRQFDAFQICSIAVGLVADISRALEAKMEPYTREIMEALVESLKEVSLHRSVKPTVISCFGDIALAIGAQFEPYFKMSMMLLLQASLTEAPQDNEDMIEYINTLRESVLEAYTGIVVGLKDGNRIDLFMPCVDPVVQLLQRIAADQARDIGVLNKAVGLIGDLASALGPNARQALNQPYAGSLLQEALDSGDPEAVQTATWARQLVVQIQQ